MRTRLRVILMSTLLFFAVLCLNAVQFVLITSGPISNLRFLTWICIRHGEKTSPHSSTGSARPPYIMLGRGYSDYNFVSASRPCLSAVSLQTALL